MSPNTCKVCPKSKHGEPGLLIHPPNLHVLPVVPQDLAIIVSQFAHHIRAHLTEADAVAPAGAADGDAVEAGGAFVGVDGEEGGHDAAEGVTDFEFAADVNRFFVSP